MKADVSAPSNNSASQALSGLDVPKETGGEASDLRGFTVKAEP